ncbi:hypothetical protein NL676_030750, partial [Syzygium grande]
TMLSSFISLQSKMKLLLLLLIICRVSVPEATNEDDLELERQVKIMNKPPVKTFA